MAERFDLRQTGERIPLVQGGDATDPADASVGAALERLLTASQGVVTKRIDLALLEAQGLVSRGLISVFLLALNVVWIAAAWCAFAIGAVTLVLGNDSFVQRAGAFGVLNAAAALVGILILRRWAVPKETDRGNDGLH
ncbi:MAG: hypothetical protein ACRDL7_08580 [Gaiellaceae bacterium]